MKLTSASLTRIYITIFLVAIAITLYEAYKQITKVKKQRRQLLYNFYDENLDNITYVDVLETRFVDKKAEIARIIRMKADINIINTNQRIYNEIKLGTVNPRTFVIVIQVHSNVFYLNELIESLENVNAIKKSLLIFSHDVFNEEINRLIKNITFAKYTQIFYPFSIQLHPEVFPGANPHFCTEEFDCVISNIRDAETAQTKNHWWWQVNHIFDHLKVTKNYNGTIIFLEEDNYVTADFIYTFRMLKNVRDERCPECQIISLGGNDPSLHQYHVNDAVVYIKTWDKQIHRTGIAFDREVWNIIKDSSHDFCYFNDCNWDNCLKHVANIRMDRFKAIVAEGSRVFRFEKCDEDDPGCKMEYKVDEVKKFVRLITRGLFFGRVILNKTEDYVFTPTASGFFDDVRDKELCMYFSKKEVLF